MEEISSGGGGIARIPTSPQLFFAFLHNITNLRPLFWQFNTSYKDIHQINFLKFFLVHLLSFIRKFDQGEVSPPPKTHEGCEGGRATPWIRLCSTNDNPSHSFCICQLRMWTAHQEYSCCLTNRLGAEECGHRAGHNILDTGGNMAGIVIWQFIHGGQTCRKIRNKIWNKVVLKAAGNIEAQVYIGVIPDIRPFLYAVSVRISGFICGYPAGRIPDIRK